MVLAQEWPAASLLTDARDRHWLGVALWEEAFPHLRQITPTDPALRLQWPLLLEVLQDRDDLGTPLLTWDLLIRPSEGIKPELARLASRLRPDAVRHFRTLLARRPGASGRHGSLAWANVTRQGKHPGIKLFVPDWAEKPAVRIRLVAQDGALAVSSDVSPPKTSVWGRKAPIPRRTRASCGSRVHARLPMVHQLSR
jgi:hypothetical protein